MKPLIDRYDLEVFTPPCEPGAERFSAIAHLSADIREIFPYLDATLRGAVYEPAVPSLSWRKAGHYVVSQPMQIAISNVEDREGCHAGSGGADCSGQPHLEAEGPD